MAPGISIFYDAAGISSFSLFFIRCSLARSLSGTSNFLPTLGFLVYGPMMDIKNVIMLHSYFKKKFIIRLTVTISVICYVVVVVLGMLGGGIVL